MVQDEIVDVENVRVELGGQEQGRGIRAEIVNLHFS